MEKLAYIRHYIDILEHELGLNIVIYDECRLLSQTPLTTLPQIGKWHTNPYCLKIKENDRLRARCVYLKQAFINRVLQGNGVVKSTCFCGVTEYALPIQYDGRLVCLISAIGYLGQISERMITLLSQRVGLGRDQLLSLRQSALLKTDREEVVIHAVELLGYLLGRFIIEETKIPTLLDTARREGNDHVFKAMAYIAQNFSSPIHADALAEHCHVSTSYLQHLFSEVIGHGIAEEIRHQRLSYAKELLCTTDYSIRYICFLSGFSSTDYFSTVFKKYFKLPPLQYRKRHRQAVPAHGSDQA